MEQYYKTNLHGKDGGSKFRARFGVEREGVSLLADGSYTVGAELKDGYPEFNYGILKRLGWDKDLTETERATIQKSGGAPPDTLSRGLPHSGRIHPGGAGHGRRPPGNGQPPPAP